VHHQLIRQLKLSVQLLHGSNIVFNTGEIITHVFTLKLVN
jgi:hypothetical protein